MNKFILMLIGYFIGSVPFAYISGKVFGQLDIRNYGSGNSGATNAFRVLGAKAGGFAFLGDFIKGFIAVKLGIYFLGLTGGITAGLFAVIGHCYPIFLKFKGGKGVATTAGLIFAVNPLIGIILFIILVSIIYITRIVSLASVTGAILFPLVSYFFNMPKNFIYISVILGIFIIYRHKSNVKRLINGTESKFE